MIKLSDCSEITLHSQMEIKRSELTEINSDVSIGLLELNNETVIIPPHAVLINNGKRYTIRFKNDNALQEWKQKNLKEFQEVETM